MPAPVGLLDPSPAVSDVDSSNRTVVAIVDKPQRASGSVTRNGIFLIMLVGALYFTRAIALPAVLAMLVTFVAMPAVRRLSYHGVPAAVSSVVMVAALSSLLLIGALLLQAPVADVISRAPEIARELTSRLISLGGPFSLLNDASTAAEAGTSVTQGTSVSGSLAGIEANILTWVLGALRDVGSVIAATLLLTLFLLPSGESLKVKIVHLLPLVSDKQRMARALSRIELEVSRYLLTVALINTGLGICIGTAMWLLGMPYPLLWGVGAAALNFVPYAGTATGVSLAAAVSLTINSDVGAAVVPPLAYLALNSLEGAVVTPTIVGRRLALNPVAILVTLGLTTWMWGLFGTIIGVPLLVVFKTFCDAFPSLQNIALFISADTPILSDADPIG